MTPVPIDLPVKAGEAGQLAGLVLDQAQGRKPADMRTRLAPRIAALRLSSLQAFPGSLQRDPYHPSTFYMAVDTKSGSLLLRMAPESSPSSGLFPNSLLIGRMRTEGHLEVVVNAIPFGPQDFGVIRTFAEEVDRGLLPRLGINLPAVRATPATASALWHATLWNIIRSGWSEGWAAVLQLASAEDVAAAGNLPGDFTRFSAVQQPVEVYDRVRELRAGRAFEFELDLTGSTSETTPEQLTSYLESFRPSIRPVQLLAPRLDPEPRDTLEARIVRLLEAARPFNAALSIDPALTADPGLRTALGRMMGGRINNRFPRQPEDFSRSGALWRS